MVGHDLEEYVDRDDLVNKLAYYLDNDEARRQIADQGYETASQNSFEVTSRILAAEINRVINTERKSSWRLHYWIRARAKCWYFSFRDYISLKRRALGL